MIVHGNLSKKIYMSPKLFGRKLWRQVKTPENLATNQSYVVFEAK